MGGNHGQSPPRRTTRPPGPNRGKECPISGAISPHPHVAKVVGVEAPLASICVREEGPVEWLRAVRDFRSIMGGRGKSPPRQAARFSGPNRGVEFPTLVH